MLERQTPRASQSEHTRERILTEATLLFARKGYYATSISDLARGVEMTKGALYHHFPSKEAIFFAVIQRIRSIWRNTVARDMLRSKTALERIESLVDNHTRLLAENESFCLVLNALMIEMEASNPEYLAALQQIYLELARFIETIITKGQADGTVRTGVDAPTMALTIVGILRGVGCSGRIFEKLNADLATIMATAKRAIIASLEP